MAWDWAVLASLAYEEARVVLRDPERAQDAAQEATLRAWRRAGQCRTPGTPEPWLRAIARREALRLATARPQVELLAAALADAGVEEAAVLRVDVASALGALRAGDRALLEQRYWEDLTCSEIAARLDISAATVKVRLHRARERLRRQLRFHQPAVKP